MSAPKKYCVCVCVCVRYMYRKKTAICLFDLCILLQVEINVPDDQKCMLQSSLDIRSTLAEAS